MIKEAYTHKTYMNNCNACNSLKSCASQHDQFSMCEPYRPFPDDRAQSLPRLQPNLRVCMYVLPSISFGCSGHQDYHDLHHLRLSDKGQKGGQLYSKIRKTTATLDNVLVRCVLPL